MREGVAEEPGDAQGHVDAGPAELRERDQLDARHPAGLGLPDGPHARAGPAPRRRRRPRCAWPRCPTPRGRPSPGSGPPRRGGGRGAVGQARPTSHARRDWAGPWGRPSRSCARSAARGPCPGSAPRSARPARTGRPGRPARRRSRPGCGPAPAPAVAPPSASTAASSPAEPARPLARQQAPALGLDGVDVGPGRDVAGDAEPGRHRVPAATARRPGAGG